MLFLNSSELVFNNKNDKSQDSWPYTLQKRLCHTLHATSHQCHLSSHGVSSQNLVQSQSYALEKIYNKQFSKGNNSANIQWRVKDLLLCISIHCHLSTYDVSSQYLEKSWSYAPDNIYINFLSRGKNLANKHGRVMNLVLCTFSQCNLSTYEDSIQYLGRLLRYAPHKCCRCGHLDRWWPYSSAAFSVGR